MEKPDDAVDVAIMPPDAYASLLDTAVAHFSANAHAGADVAVAVSGSVVPVVASQLVVYVFQLISDESTAAE